MTVEVPYIRKCTQLNFEENVFRLIVKGRDTYSDSQDRQDNQGKQV